MQSLNKLFIFFSFSFLLGVFYHNESRDFFLSFLFLSITVIILINFYWYVKKYSIFLLCIICGFITGLLISERHQISVLEKKQFIESFHNTQEHVIELEIKRIHKKSDFDITYLSKVQKIGEVRPDFHIYALFKTKVNFDLSSGQKISFSTHIVPLQAREAGFDYASFLQSQNIYIGVYSHDFQNIGARELLAWEKTINQLRKRILHDIHNVFPQNEAIFLGGILIGARESIPEDLQNSFNNSGLTHLIAVSGYNITIVIVFLSSLLIYIPKLLRILIISFGVLLYVYIVGDSPAVLRAALMGMVGYYVLMSGRQGDSLAIILFSALVMLCVNPFLISYDISFQLSFLAVFGLLYTQGFFERIFFFLPKKFAIQESFVLTLSAFVFTVPIMLGNFGQISILAPIANMLVAWSIPFAMLFGVITLGIGTISQYGAFVIGMGEYLLLKWTTGVATIFGSLDFALLRVELGEYTPYYQILYFMLVVFAILYFPKEKTA